MQVIRDLEGLEFNVVARESIFCQVLLNESAEFDVTVLVLQLLDGEALLLLQVGSEGRSLLQELIVVVLGEVDARLLVLLDLLQNGPVLVLHVELGLVQLIDALFVVLEGDLHFVFGLQAFVHDLLDLLHGHITLLLAEECLLDLYLQLLGLVPQVHVMLLALFVLRLLLVVVVEDLTGLIKLLLGSVFVVTDV